MMLTVLVACLEIRKKENLGTWEYKVFYDNKYINKINKYIHIFALQKHAKAQQRQEQCLQK